MRRSRKRETRGERIGMEAGRERGKEGVGSENQEGETRGRKGGRV